MGESTNLLLLPILSSRAFAGAHRSQLFLRYIVDHALNHPGDPLKEYSIALDVFDRDPSYDPAVDATVRVEAGRLRSRLRDYYASEGCTDPLVIEIPKGSYRALIHPRAQTPSPPPALARPRRSWAVPLAFLIGALFGYRASH